MPHRPLGRGTLGRQLVVRVAALVALIAVLLSAATTVAVRQILMANVSEDLYAAATEVDRDLKYRRAGACSDPGSPSAPSPSASSHSGAVDPNAKIDGRGRGADQPAPDCRRRACCARRRRTASSAP